MRKIEICVYVLTSILWVCNPAKSFVIHCNLLNSGKSFAFQRHPSQSSTSRRYSSQHNAVLCKIKGYPLQSTKNSLQSSDNFAIYHKPLQLPAIILNHELYIRLHCAAILCNTGRCYPLQSIGIWSCPSIAIHYLNSWLVIAAATEERFAALAGEGPEVEASSRFITDLTQLIFHQIHWAQL